jgi:hypothetical protein
MMIRAFPKHLGAAFRAPLLLTRATSLMCYPFSTFGTDAITTFTHIVPALLNH